MMMQHFISVGEASGDLHGCRLMQAMRASNLPMHFTGVGGPLMRGEGLDSILNMEEFQVMGLTDVLKSFPRLYKNFYVVRDAILKKQPDCVILIDSPAFHLRLAK